MDKDLREIVAAAVCSFNVEIDKNGEMVEIISSPCPDICQYCRLFAEHICKRIEEGQNDK